MVGVLPPRKTPMLGASPMLGGQPSLDFLTQIPHAIQSATGWQPGTTPQWVPDWLRNLSAANTAQTQRTQQNLAALPPRYAMTPQDINTAMSLGMNADILAYHGSPYTFDAFDASKIGTGEGAQAYGHGLYFAENPGVAKGYQSRTSSPYYSTGTGDIVPSGDVFQRMQDAASQAGAVHPDQSRGIVNNILEGVDQSGSIDKYLNDYELPGGQFGPAYQAAAKAASDLGIKPHTGSLYKVDIQPEPEQFLDWDKPLSEQSPQVQQNLADVKYWHGVPSKNNVGTETTGGQLVQHLEQKYGQNKAGVTDILQQAGIPGIRYLDQGSRGEGQGTHNYVVFDPAHIRILERDNQPIGPMLGVEPQLGK